MSRKVNVFKHGDDWSEEDQQFNKELIATAIFHQFGVDYDDLIKGIGSRSAAIVEFDNGSVKLVPLELIQFIENKDGE